MSDEPTPEEKFNAEDPYTMVPRELARGRDRNDIISELVQLDWKPHVATALVDRIASEIRALQASSEVRRQYATDAKRHMLAGAMLVLAGIGLTTWTFLAALAQPGAYAIITLGMVIAGAIVFRRGYSRWSLFRMVAGRLESRTTDNP